MLVLLGSLHGSLNFGTYSNHPQKHWVLAGLRPGNLGQQPIDGRLLAFLGPYKP